MASGDEPSETFCANALRVLTMDAIANAGNGHPGAPMGMAPLAYVLWSRFLRFDPDDSGWFDRDRVVLSNGHGSMLLYGALHLAGYDVTMDDLASLRQLGSRTPAHPEYGLTPGVEVTTGPLGQGVANGVGMAMAERRLAHEHNAAGPAVVGHRTWVFAGDGDMMEGVACEAASLAGHLGLAKLTIVYDANGITIDGGTDLAFGEDVATRFAAYGFHVVHVDDVEDLDRVTAAYQDAVDETERPTLIVCRTHIGYGVPEIQDTEVAHGGVFTTTHADAARETFGWTDLPPFTIPSAVYRAWQRGGEEGRRAHKTWSDLLVEYATVSPPGHEALTHVIDGSLPADWADGLEWPASRADEALPTREASGWALNEVAARVSNLVGGSADLTETTFSAPTDPVAFSAVTPGRFVHFGVREHAMGAIANGLALHGMRPYVSTFLTFSDYMKPAIRLAALMRLPVVFLLCHDSIGLAGDGPTHQPVEQLPGLRATSGLTVLRPGDAAETVAAWRLAMENTEGPTAILLTRQPVRPTGPVVEATDHPLRRGGYVVAEERGDSIDVVLLTSGGSEIAAALGAKHMLEGEHDLATRVVALPSWDLFERQDEDYRASVLGPYDVTRVAVEAASSFGWHRWLGTSGATVTVDRFGACGQGEEILDLFGFTPDHVTEVVLRTRSGGTDR